MLPEVVAALIGFLGVVIGAIPTYLFMRQKSLAEVDKLKAETDKIKAEAEKIRAELQPSGVAPVGTVSQKVPMKTTEEQEETMVLSATYGKGETRKDVTGIIRAILAAARTGHASLVVENENLGGDPLKSVKKELVVVYVRAGERHTRIIAEHEELSLP